MCGNWLDNSFQVQAKGVPPSAQTDMSFGFFDCSSMSKSTRKLHCRCNFNFLVQRYGHVKEYKKIKIS